MGFTGGGDRKEKVFKDKNETFYQWYLHHTFLGRPRVPSRTPFCIIGCLG